MIAVLVLPPLLAWGMVPVYRWLTTPKPVSPNTSFIPAGGTTPLPTRAINDTVSDLPASSAPAPNPPKP